MITRDRPGGRLSWDLDHHILIGQDITIVGAGIGGLAAAIALARRGANVRVLERANALQEVGAGIQISPNGMAVLVALGVDFGLIPRSVIGKKVSLLDGRTGRLALSLDLNAIKTPHPWLFAHRADLLDCLTAAARDAGVVIETGVPVAAVDLVDGGVDLEFWDNTNLTTRVVIGADGVHSVARQAVDRVSKPRFTGQVAWRALVPGDGTAAPEARVYMGSGRHLVTYPLRGGHLTNIVAVQERQAWTEDGWHHQDDPNNLRHAFKDFGPEVRDLLDQVDETHLWGLFRHAVAPNWHKGPVTLVGDAVHPTLPFMAQGACMALEDAWALAASMSLHNTPEMAFAAYQASRRARCVKIVAAANTNARAYHFGNVLRPLAHTAMRMSQAIAPNAPLRRLAWLYEYDVTRAMG
ncbi:FAD-dependent monooxygenase [Meridianimarinicoccus aquatilis]|uniref:FAD-dependent monooxygenase n=1 Tax=Meridianimarinicoccus aquatilis TaxID=2552766 RepID=UPI0024424DC9|nr:FAD-dependent monooxygenase [Fluviibacterium aquatile]